MLIGSIPVLPALNLAETVAFYESKLGFSNPYMYDDYAIIKRDSAEIHFWKCEDRAIAENTSCRILVTGVEALYREYQPQGIIHPNAPLATKPWGTREFAIIDVNGNLVVFFERGASA